MPNSNSTFIKNSKWVYDLPFAVILVVIFFCLGYNEALFLDPQGIHFIRQTDSLAFASQYFHNGFNFFEPSLYNLDSIDGKAACEFPIIYFFTALLYGIFGEKFFILKLINFLIAWSGVLALYKLSLILLKDYFFAILITLFLFTSTVFNYYGLNYLPDATALGLVFIGWYFFIKSNKNTNRRAGYLSIIFFVFAGLIKITSLISLMAILCSTIILVFNKKETNKQYKSFIYFGILGIVMVVAWNIYMYFYNIHFESTYFTTSARPIWSLSQNKVLEVLDYLRNYWFNKYFAQSSYHLLLVVFLYRLYYLSKHKEKVSFITIFLILGSIAYFLLFFIQFKEHDYYVITLFPAVICILIQGVLAIQNSIRSAWGIWTIKAVLSIIILTGISYSQSKLTERYNNPIDDISLAGISVKHNLSSLNLPSNAKIVVVPDKSKNGSLLYLNRRGWTVSFKEMLTKKKITHFKEEGANFLLLTSNDSNLIKLAKDHGTIIYENGNIILSNLNNESSN